MLKRSLGTALAVFTLLVPLSTNTGVGSAAGPTPIARQHRQNLDRSGSILPSYNFPAATRGDRFARHGLKFRAGIVGWRHYGRLIKRVARSYDIDPYVLGAYVWVESGFNAKQDYSHDGFRAIGLGSVQATDHPKCTLHTLQDPYTNLCLTAQEFSEKWTPHDMAGTVMDVWYPAWRRKLAHGEDIPVVQSPDVYVQAIANRYYALREIDSHFRMDS
ncbi:MAG TPA: hypothetical protein V6D47_09750 [Oscillatoriaceae cyanobacterium]